MDVYDEPILNVADAATYLAMPASTLGLWKRNRLIHSLPAEHGGWPSLPFAAIVEAFVLRSLRQVGFTQRKIAEAAEGIRRAFKDDYGLARPSVGHDGVEIFLQVGKDLLRARDQQQVIRDTVHNFTRCIEWNGQDPERLKLIQFDGNVILDPRFGWGRPVVADNKVPLEAILGLWRGRESMEAIAKEFNMDRAQVERIIQAYDAARDAA